VQVIVQLGAKPIFVDLDGKFKITKRTKAIMPVHIEGDFYGDMKNLLNVAKGIPIIEDAAQALGATQNGKKAGSFGLAGCFSFYPAKILGAYGDGGALTTNDKNMYEYVKEARNHFKDTNADWGVNSRLDNMQATVLNIKLKHLKNTLARRAEIAKMYDKGLCNLDLILPPTTKGRVWQDYLIRTNKRDELFDYLKENGVQTIKNNYPFPVKKLPQAQKYEDETLRIPCNPELNNNEVLYVIKIIKEFFKQYAK